MQSNPKFIKSTANLHKLLFEPNNDNCKEFMASISSEKGIFKINPASV